MKFAFVIFKYFPFGGAQRDMMRIAQASVRRGHEVHIFTQAWDGPQPQTDISVHTMPGAGWPNFRRYRDFIRQVQAAIAEIGFDFVVGFNRLPGLGAYFAADPCFVERAHARWGNFYRLSARYRFFADCEKAVFAPDSGCEILLLSPAEKAEFQRWYTTPDARFHLLPPFISPERFVLQDPAQVRASVREEFGFGADDALLLMVGSGFKTKGLDRAIQALAALPQHLRDRTRLLAVGQDNPRFFMKMAKRLGVSDHVVVVAGRNDVPRLMQGADLLVHPAYRENTGLVLLEAGACGLPVLASDVCGYAFHIRQAESGKLIASPFSQQQFNQQMEYMLTSANREPWSQNGKCYANALMQANDGSAEAEMIENFARRKVGTA